MASATPDLRLPSQDGQAELTWVAGYWRCTEVRLTPNIRPNLGQTSVIIHFCIHRLQFALRSVLTAQLLTGVTANAPCCTQCIVLQSPFTISTKNHWVTSFTTYWHLADVMYNIACIQLQSRVHTPRVSINIVAPKFTSMVLVLEVHRSSANTHSVTNKWLHLIEKLITVIKCTQS